jgi:NADPH:quinone reductase-like Zn-dependent oxidoreductase
MPLLSLVPTGAESTWSAGLWGASFENSPKSARHLFRNFEDGNLRQVVSAAIRNAEVVSAAAHLDEPDPNRGQDSQMMSYLCRILERLDVSVWN